LLGMGFETTIRVLNDRKEYKTGRQSQVIVMTVLKDLLFTFQSLVNAVQRREKGLHYVI